MRQIKFRGFSIKLKKWVYGHYKETQYGHYIGNKDVVPYEVIPESVRQYTGIKDKNGKEIYEGDIMNGLNGSFNESGKVEFYEGGFVLRLKSHWENLRNLKKYDSKWEVIGNIYENKELLK